MALGAVFLSTSSALAGSIIVCLSNGLGAGEGMAVYAGIGFLSLTALTLAGSARG